MCVSPGKLADGTEFACRKCWQCLEQRIDDWVGRCLAESKTSVASHSITLTYGRDGDGNTDHLRAAWLTYSDVQKHFKLLRRDGFRFRYLVAGEYGSTKGRAHWHMLMFWKDRVPPHELTTMRHLEKRFHNKYWPHGFQHWEEPNAKSIRYVCKYIQKDVAKDERQAHFAMSKKPPLGDTFFRNRAMQYVEQGLAPQNLYYSFPDVKAGDGRPKQFYMTGTTAHNFIEEYKALWARHRGGFHPNSTLIEEHDDRIARASYFAPKDTFGQHIREPEGGTEPVVGNHPETGERALYSDLFGYRWWYLKREDEWGWQKGHQIGRTVPKIWTPHLGANRYDNHKRGPDGPSK